MDTTDNNLAPKSVLIVDDEPDICNLIAMSVEKAGLTAQVAHSLEQANHALTPSIALCLSDLRLGDGTGMDLIQKSSAIGVPIAILTAHGNVENAVQALKYGAFDFLSKPIENHQLTELLEAALHLPRTRDPVMPLLVGESAEMTSLKSLILKVARSQAPIYISGPSGSGKECVAKSIHALSARSNGPFVPINCGAIPHPLIESELFGYQKGSFTGANEDKVGLFEQANGGTLFLDEVGDLPLDMQVKLLRAIQEKKIRPIGASEERPINVRLLSATAHSLSEMVKQQQFREDLYYRLNVIECQVPALRDRKDDLAALVAHIFKKIAPSRPLAINNAALERLRAYSFPGNVRELENILERAATLTSHDLIGADDLQLPSMLPSAPSSLDEQIEALEKKAILEALETVNGNKKKAAVLLGIPYRSLRYRLAKFALENDSQA
jgi:two-component system response regulator PilR (NtrC family)